MALINVTPNRLVKMSKTPGGPATVILPGKSTPVGGVIANDGIGMAFPSGRDAVLYAVGYPGVAA
jgi:hypothetical protein